MVEYVSVTSLLVGTTTMKFGVARYGPSAPDTVQFGKYDVFTITGTPVRDTWNDTESSVVRIRLTSTAGAASSGSRLFAGSDESGTSAWVTPGGRARFHSSGPSATSGRPRMSSRRASTGVVAGASHHGTATSSCQSPAGTPGTTTGSNGSPSTSFESRTS